jgi:hypothetical protein
VGLHVVPEPQQALHDGHQQPAAAADGSRFVWAPGDAGIQVVYSVGFGNSWSQAQGIPANAIVESDRVNPQKFYGFSNGTFYVSTNGGQSFTAAATGLPASGVKFKAVPGREGDIWLAGSTGLFRSTNSGTSFAKLSGVTDAVNVAFGRSAPGQSYQAIFIVGTVDGVKAVYRSDDTASTWLRVNDNAHQYGNVGDALAGDPRIYGRVYLGTNGRGILYADRTGAPPTSPPPTSAPPTTPPPTTPPPTTPPPTTPPPTTGAPGTCAVTYTITNQWGGGFQADLKVQNTGSTAINGWTLVWSFANGQQITQIWNATDTQSGATVTARNETYNGAIAAGAAVTFGFLGSWTTANAKPTGFALNGSACATS